jgi:hypothetical protein
VSKRAIAPKSGFMGARVSSVSNGSKVEMSRWKGMDMDISDDQQDITRGRGMVDSKFQGAAGIGGTHVRHRAYPLCSRIGVSLSRARSNGCHVVCSSVRARVVQHACMMTRYEACVCVLTGVVRVVFNRSPP